MPTVADGGRGERSELPWRLDAGEGSSDLALELFLGDAAGVARIPE